MAAISKQPSRPSAVSLPELVEALLRREPRALGRAVSLLEQGGEAQRQLVRRLRGKVGRARVVGVTGPPGAGKSTLVLELARTLRRRGETVGVLAVDPTSPYSGGALLGDRIRMQELATDPGVFIRSMATRGAMGGLARATRDAADVLDAAGFDWVLVETVGVGQDEVDVVRSSDTVIVVLVPGLGDDVQAIKAGLLEIADLFVINKADREGVERLRRDLEQMLGLGEERQGGWRPPIVETVARRGEGVAETLAEIERHRLWLSDTGELAERRRGQLLERVERILRDRLLDAARDAGLAEEVEKGAAEGRDPHEVAQRVYEAVVRGQEENGE